MKYWLVTLQLCLVLVQLVLCEVSSSEAKLFCVSETGNCDPSSSCGQDCHPLMWFVNETNVRTIPNDSTIIFQPGDHSLNSTESSALVTFSNKTNLKLIGKASNVVCTGNNSGFLFQYSTNVQIANLSFHDCGSNIPLQRDSHLYGCVFFHLSYDVSISNIGINNCNGFGLHMDNVCGESTIQNSVFARSKGGNAVFWFRHCNQTTITQTSLLIRDSHFLDGDNTLTQNATGIYLIIMREKLNVTLRHVNLTNNTGKYGGNLAIKFTRQADDESNVTIDDCQIEGGKATSSGGGMMMWFEKTWLKTNRTEDCPSDGSSRPERFLTVKNTHFVNNIARSGGGVLLTYHERPGTGCTTREVEFHNCTFERNKAYQGSALQVSKHNLPRYLVHNSPQFKVKITKSLIVNNWLRSRKDQHNADGIVELFSVEKFVVNNTNFTDNSGTALMLVASAVQYKGNVLFQNNSAVYGGAIKLCDSSQMYFNNDTRMKLLNNRADLAGGAIYAGNQCLQQTPPCFFQMSFGNFSTIPTIDELANGILYFDGNDAEFAGKAIYGGSVDNCFTDTELSVNKSSTLNFYNSLSLFNRTFNFSTRDEPSLITSDPIGVCFCNASTNATDCHTRTLLVTSFPGQSSTLHVSAVGQTNGVVPSNIKIDQGKHFTVKHHHQSTNETKVHVLCHNVTFTVFPQQSLISKNITIKVGVQETNAVSESSTYYRLRKLQINMTIKPCPFLFELDSKNSCACVNLKGATCDINTETVTRKENSTWIGCKLNYTSGKCDVIQSSRDCQEDRCSPKNTLSRDNFSSICVEGREGRLCGRCNPNYSLSLGPLKCVQRCSAWKLVLLLLAFGFAGILLVCFLAILNFTVAEGTINGLLFYANCVHANRDAFAINDYKSPSSLPFRVFISWLNLDLGVEVCFYSGMTAYQKIWFEFGFLLYLLVLGSLIVCLSHRFVRFTRLVGRNVVPVLATIVLMAYPKLVRNSIKIWDCNENVWASDNSKPKVWSLDETVDCFVGKHLVLFVLSVFLFTAAFLYTMCLLLIQCLQRGSGWRVLRWVNKLRPFFDANTGPCRDHYRFWPGLFLFARIGVYLVFWRTDDTHVKSYSIMALCVFMFLVACVSPRGVYKKWTLNVLEFSLLLNLGFSSAIVAPQGLHFREFSFAFIGLAAFQFLLITAYHCYKKISETRKWRRLVTKIQEKRTNRRAKRLDESEPLIRPEGMPPVIQFNAPREPLLEDD